MPVDWTTCEKCGNAVPKAASICRTCGHHPNTLRHTFGLLLLLGLAALAGWHWFGPDAANCRPAEEQGLRRGSKNDAPEGANSVTTARVDPADPRVADDTPSQPSSSTNIGVPDAGARDLASEEVPSINPYNSEGLRAAIMVALDTGAQTSWQSGNLNGWAVTSELQSYPSEVCRTYFYSTADGVQSPESIACRTKGESLWRLDSVPASG